MENNKINISDFHEDTMNWLLDDDEQLEVYRALERVRRDGTELYRMSPLARLAFYLILTANGIDPKGMPVEEDHRKDV